MSRICKIFTIYRIKSSAHRHRFGRPRQVSDHRASQHLANREKDKRCEETAKHSLCPYLANPAPVLSSLANPGNRENPAHVLLILYNGCLKQLHPSIGQRSDAP